jgi:hypothetical protein
VKREAQFRLLVFATAFFTLMFELIISRVASFHLDFRNSFLALPIAFLGLAIGSLHVHFSSHLRENFSIRRNIYLLAGAVFATFLVIFGIFTQFLPISGVGGYHLFLPQLLLKSVIFIAVLTIPFYVFGRILTLCFHLQQAEIGKLYGLDFMGAALACLLTPILFHLVDLPAVIVTLLAAISLLLVAFTNWPAAGRFALVAALAVLNTSVYFALNFMEKNSTFAYYETEDDPPLTREIASRWNEFSRVQLVHFDYTRDSRDHYKIIHDNARSNVHVRPYQPGLVESPKILDALEAPFIMGRKPEEVLVMFAGCGAEMVSIDQYAGGKARVTGIEINRACAELVTAAPELASYRLQEFYDLPHIDLRFQEGRSFLELTDQKFDMIFVGSSAPLALAFTGHTRKYLYTKEAFHRYLDALSADGIICFDHQPIARTIDSLHSVFEERGLDNFAESIILLRSNGGADRGSPDILVKPGGFTAEEVASLRGFHARAPKQVVYAPHVRGLQGNWVRSVKQPDQTNLPTDDRPFMEDLNFAEYHILPATDDLKRPVYFMNWIYITTMLVLTAVTVIFIMIAQVSRRERRLPPSILAYLLLTGFVYLLIEVAFIAKLELFLQDALVSMASVITIFLLTSAAGSWSFRQVAVRLGMVAFPLLTAAVVGAAIVLLNVALPQLMDLSLPGRLAVTFAIIAPVGWMLGMFYPYSVAMLTKHDKSEAVPITYGISTLSSVIGASYAMTMMMEWGFNTLLLQGLAAYLILAVGIFIHSRIARVNLLG